MAGEQAGRLRLRPEVVGDIETIIDYFERRNPAVASRFVEALTMALDQVAGSPLLGSIKAFRNPRLNQVRTWRVPGFRKYLIFYRPIENGIQVILVSHGARDLRRLLLPRSN